MADQPCQRQLLLSWGLLLLLQISPVGKEVVQLLRGGVIAGESCGLEKSILNLRTSHILSHLFSIHHCEPELYVSRLAHKGLGSSSGQHDEEEVEEGHVCNLEELEQEQEKGHMCRLQDLLLKCDSYSQ